MLEELQGISQRLELQIKNNNKSKINFSGLNKITVKITSDKSQGCTKFGSLLVKGIKNTESPKWLKENIIIRQKPISAVVDVTNYVMMDLLTGHFMPMM